MKGFSIAAFEILFALFVLSLTWHWALILLFVVLLPVGILWGFIGLVDAGLNTSKGKG